MASTDVAAGEPAREGVGIAVDVHDMLVDDVGVEASTTEPLKHKIGKLVELNVVVVNVAVIVVSGVVVSRIADEEDVVTSVVVRTLSVF